MPKVVFIGVDLQRDFVGPDAVLSIPGAAEALRAAARLVRHARERGIPVLLTQDTHDEDDPAFESLPPHAILGTTGHDLAAELEPRGLRSVTREATPDFQSTGKECIAVHVPDHRRGLFGNVNADRIISSLGVEEHVLFGLPIEVGIRAAGLGLRERGRTTILVSDGLAGFDQAASASNLAALAGAGCRFLTVDGVLKRYS